MIRNTVAAIVSTAVLASACGLKLPDQLHAPTQTTSAEPKTLDAATKATQEFADRRAAGDYAGVWLMYDKQIQDGISQADYVTLGQTCGSKLEKIPVSAEGVRMEDDTHALVRIKPFGFSVQLPVVYENGKWLMAPGDEFKAELGKPVETIIADRKASKKCGNDDLSSRLSPQTPSRTTTPVTPSPKSFAAPGTRYALPAYYTEMSVAQERPTDLLFSRRFHYLSNLAWTSWGQNGADGSGEDHTQTNCDPTCANGARYTDTVQIHASNPQPPPASSGCPASVLFYSDVVMTFPNGVTAPHDTSGENFNWTTIDGVESVHSWNRVPTCE